MSNRLKKSFQSAVKGSQFTLPLVLWICAMSLSFDANATDLLAGTTEDLVDTLNTSGKMYMYIAQIVIAIVTYIRSQNILVLTTVIVLCVAFDVMMHIAGLS